MSPLAEVNLHKLTPTHFQFHFREALTVSHAHSKYLDIFTLARSTSETLALGHLGKTLVSRPTKHDDIIRSDVSVS